ncbi:MAG: response regulator transcription factor [Acholeplasmataceae bacterium]
MKILVVDDNKIINESITQALKTHNFLVDSVFDGETALHYISTIKYDCIVLDIMMPKLDGFQVVKLVREKEINTPILFLSARQKVEDRIKGLSLGGDDYLIKPFSMEELLARIQVLIRQKENKSDLIYQVDNLVVNASGKTVFRNNQEINLSSKEYNILLYLIRNKNKVLSREQILEYVWDLDYEGTSNIVDVYINYLRKKLNINNEKNLIQTIYTLGYVIKDEEK